MRFIGVGTLILIMLSLSAKADLVGHWTFEEGTGETTADLSPSGTTGAITNAATGGLGTDGSVWVVDPDPNRGSVISFNGAADSAYVSAGFIPTMTLDNDFTWAFWANHSSANGQPNNIIFGNRYAADGVDFSPRQFIKFTPTKFEWHMNGNGNDNMEYDDMINIADIWHHHAVVKTGADLTYYRDGVEANTSTITQPLDVPQPLYFGGDNTGADGENWMGMLDDVRIYDNALTAAEVLALAPDAPDPPPMPLPPFPVAEGNWNVRILGIDQRPPAFDGDGDVNDAAEMRAILDYVGPYNGDYISDGTSVAGQAGASGPTTNEALNLNGWGIWEDHQVSRNVVDMAGAAGTFDSNHPYPGPNPPNLGEDFIVAATTDDELNFAPGTYAISFGSDDGGYLTVKPTEGTFAFDAEFNTDGDGVLDDTILFNGTRGIAATCGEFTVGSDGMSAHIESAMFERSGGDGYEISIAAGGCVPFGNGFFQLLSDNSIANDAGTGFLVTTGTPVPNPSDGLPCDLDADGDCDQADIDMLYAGGTDAAGIDAWLTQASAADNPYKADAADTYVLGDTNLNGDVDSSDLGLLLNNFGKTGDAAATWNGGDLNASGGVDSGDLGLLLNNFGSTSAAATVPEPSAISLLFVAALSMLGLRRRS